MSERTAVQVPILNALKRLGIWAIRVNSGVAKRGRRTIMLAPAGTSDIIGHYHSKAMFIEVKKPGGTLSEAQKKFLADREREGCICIVAESVDDVLKGLGLT